MCVQVSDADEAEDDDDDDVEHIQLGDKVRGEGQQGQAIVCGLLRVAAAG
jgi:hypothetical protein